MPSEQFVIPQELKSPTKMAKWLYVSDVIFIMVYFLIFLVLNIFVDERLHVAYYIFNLIISLSLVIKSPYNPPKRFYHSIFYFLIRDRNVYHPISIPKKCLNGNTDIDYTRKTDR